MLFAAMSTFSSSACADELARETVYFPAYKGYVVSYERPMNWQDSGRNIISKKRYTYEDGQQQELQGNTFSSSIKDMKALNEKIGFKPPGSYDGEMDFRVSQFHLPRPINLANWVQKEKQSWKNYAMKVYGEGFVNHGGKESFYYENSNLTILKNGEEVEAVNPTSKRVIIQFNDEVLLEISFGVRYFEEQFIALKPVCEKMLNSIQVTPIEKLAKKEVPKLYVTPEVVLADGGHGYSVGFSFILPWGWAAELIDVKPATQADTRGKLAVKVFPEEGNDTSALLLIAEALPPESNGFLETGDHLIEKLIKDIDPGSVENTKMPHRFICSGHVYNLIFKAGGKITQHKTFQGKNPNGHSVKARIYTGGNRQAACNFIYINDTADYEKLLPTIEKIFNSIESIEDMVR